MIVSDHIGYAVCPAKADDRIADIKKTDGHYSGRSEKTLDERKNKITDVDTGGVQNGKSPVGSIPAPVQQISCAHQKNAEKNPASAISRRAYSRLRPEKLVMMAAGIVFEVQGWEYPAVMDEKGHIIRMNLRAEDCEDHAWYGLREFSSDAWPDAFPTSLKDYYPDGIRDGEGNPVTDLWEECCSRDRFGAPIHAQWVEVKDHQETCYQMCRNNPVWREYLHGSEQ